MRWQSLGKGARTAVSALQTACTAISTAVAATHEVVSNAGGAVGLVRAHLGATRKSAENVWRRAADRARRLASVECLVVGAPRRAVRRWLLALRESGLASALLGQWQRLGAGSAWRRHLHVHMPALRRHMHSVGAVVASVGRDALRLAGVAWSAAAAATAKAATKAAAEASAGVATWRAAAHGRRQQKAEAATRAKGSAEQQELRGRQTEQVRRVMAAGDHYAVLELADSSSTREVKSSFRALARLLHPDKSSVPETERAFLRLQEAHGAPAVRGVR